MHYVILLYKAYMELYKIQSIELLHTYAFKLERSIFLMDSLSQSKVCTRRFCVYVCGKWETFNKT